MDCDISEFNGKTIKINGDVVYASSIFELFFIFTDASTRQ